ncbi:MAG: aldehyde dehydrogenase family protein [Planctomycetota bacterium]|nr:aldehyde dehydrogenase family protein [Planctomycetota bacterium]
MDDSRIPVTKSWKLFIGGQFPRSESGRTEIVRDGRERVLGHVARASVKDLREAVAAARRAQGSWSRRTAYNRGQILYRLAEMVEGKAEEFCAALRATSSLTPKRAAAEVAAAADRLVAFAGWTDKYPQVLGSHNPVAGPYYNFTVPEACGVVGVLAPEEPALLGLVSLLAPPLCAGNAVVALGSRAHPLATVLFAEACATADVPHGVVNLLTGRRGDLVTSLAEHRDVEAIHAAGSSKAERKILESGAAENLKRVRVRDLDEADWSNARRCESPEWIEAFVEMKTIWHPSAT